jgi:hypothetical protein
LAGLFWGRRIHGLTHFNSFIIFIVSKFLVSGRLLHTMNLSSESKYLPFLYHHNSLRLTDLD